MYVKIEPSGCSSRRGMVQVRLSMWLEPKDDGYDIFNIDNPVFPENRYEGNPEDFEEWVKKLPTEKLLIPFHNHFIQVSPETPDKEIMDIAEAFMHEAYIRFMTGDSMDIRNDGLPAKIKEYTAKELTDRVTSAKQISLERKA